MKGNAYQEVFVSQFVPNMNIFQQGDKNIRLQSGLYMCNATLNTNGKAKYNGNIERTLQYAKLINLYTWYMVQGVMVMPSKF